MKLTEHIAFENDIRQMFIGQTICSVIYGEVKYYDENGDNINPKPCYKTKYPDVDTLDHSIYFTMENTSIYIFWDNTFTCYGLKSKQIELTETTNDYEQKWNVSTENKWIDFIGQKITDFKIHWKGEDVKIYPQTFQITTENGKSVFITASELKDSEDEYYSQMDNILVMTNSDLLKQLEEIEERSIKNFKAKRSIWAKIFG